MTNIRFYIKLINNEINKNAYFLSAINKVIVYISKLPIDSILATWAVRLEVSIYTFYSANAWQVAKDAGNGQPPIYENAHLYKNGVMQKGIFFDHWRKYKHGNNHCMFGTPYINL